MKIILGLWLNYLIVFFVGIFISQPTHAMNSIFHFPNERLQSSIRVASFNIQTSGTRFQVAPWRKRVFSISRLVTAEQFHVIGVQEALSSMLLDLSRHLPHYAYVGTGRDKGNDEGEHNALLYDKRRLQVLDTKTFWLSDQPDAPGSKGWDATCPRIVTWAHFKDLKTHKKFYIFNTHFDHMGRVAQTNSVKLLATEYHRITQGHPGIVMGDFNVSDKNAAYHLFIEKSGLSDVTAKAPHTGPKYTHSFFGLFKSRIDFIFVSPHIHINHSRTIPEEPTNRHRRSDHLPITSDLSFF